MKKKLMIFIAILSVLVLIGLAGCSLIASSTDQIANSTNGTTTTTNITTYTDVTKEDLESALTKYREIAENLSSRITELEDTVRDAVVAANTHIGAYATVYVDSVLNITCSGGSSGCQGTGFIITDNGYVLTNNHVVSYEVEEINYDDFRGYNWIGQKVYGTKTVTYTYSTITASFDAASAYPSNSSYTLEVIYRDPAYDLALCRLVGSVPVGEHWKAIPFYDGTVTRGDDLLVLGNARGFGYSATSGLVSATGKTFSDSPQLTFIQTDAAINGGNSGGPAINIYGGLVGVVNSKFVSVIKSSYFSSEIEDVEGMGFAIELTKVKEFIAAAETASSVTVSYKTISASSLTGGEELAAA